MAEKRICTKCLLQEIDEEAYRDKLLRVIDQMDRDVKAGDVLYEQRLTTCKSCDYLEAGTCRACGCYVELRAAAKKSKCPYKKW
ncbi:MAG: DUF6171 family protein [Lachnospiraceae bacterium]|nr:DUF6171 family protein [Lachnospiraceae bacterium]